MFRRRKPETVQEYLALAEQAFEKMRFDEAARLCEDAIRIDPQSAEAHDGLASSLVMLDRLDEAIAAWERAVALAPDEPEMAYSLGVAYEQKGLAEKAAAQFRRVLELEPGTETALDKLAALGEDGEAPQARGRGRWSRLTPEERDAGECLARLRRHRGKAVAWLVTASVGGVLILHRSLWQVAKDVLARRAVVQSLDEVDQIFLPLFLAIIAGLVIAALVASLRLCWLESNIRAERLDAGAIDACADTTEQRLESEERKAEREEERRREDQWVDECRRAKPWRLREVSGAHLVWWAIFVALGCRQLGWLVLSDAALNALVIGAIFGGILKGVVVLMIWRDTYRMATRYYRWWGRGWLPVVVALLPVVFGYFGETSASP